MFEILTATEMMSAESKTLETGLDVFQLMTSAGVSVAQKVIDIYKPRPTLVLCGSGHNGGDGFITASYLKKQGWDVRVACLVKKKDLKKDSKKAADMWDGDIEDLNSNLGVHKTDLIIDAVFGTGLSRPLDPEMITLFDKIRTRHIPVVAIDVPTGLDATTGIMHTGGLTAQYTITFTRKKCAHVLYPSKSFCGKIHVAQIGISDQSVAALNTQIFENDMALWAKDFPLPDFHTHKYSRGFVTVYGGSVRTGAARLCAHAAQKSGAGAISITTKPDAQSIYQNDRASFMVDVWSDIDALKSILRDERRNTLLIGSGAGIDNDLKNIAEAALSFHKKIVFDGDIFSVFKNKPTAFFEKLSPDLHVLTPHEGEFKRMFGTLDGNKIERAQKAAKISNAIIVLKGADTIIASPDGTTVINTNAPPTLSTAGSGDVLSGLIAGITAQGMNPFMAACAACWLHGRAAKKHGLGLTAEDIISLIPQTLNDVFWPEAENR